MIFFSKNLLASIGDKVKATNDDTTIEKDKAMAVSLNKVPDIPLIKINGMKTASKIRVVAIIAKVICFEPLYMLQLMDFLHFLFFYKLHQS